MAREICKCCGQISAVGFYVPDDVWRICVPEFWINRVLCLSCFTRFADEQLVQWDKKIQFYPVSRVTSEKR